MTPSSPYADLAAQAAIAVGAVWAFVMLCCLYGAMTRGGGSHRRP